MASRTKIALLITVLFLAIGAGIFWWSQKGPTDQQAESSQSTTTETATNLLADTESDQPRPRIIDVELFQFGVAPDPLILTAGETVTLRFSTRDVAHSFSMGDEGFEEWNISVEPNKPIEKTFTVPNLLGDFIVACDIFCGKGHAEMHGTIRVLPQPDKTSE